MSDPKEIDKIIDLLHELNEADASLVEALEELDSQREAEKKVVTSQPLEPEPPKRR